MMYGSGNGVCCILYGPRKIFENDLGQGRQKLLLYNQFVIGTPPPKKKSAFEQISKCTLTLRECLSRDK